MNSSLSFLVTLALPFFCSAADNFVFEWKVNGPGCDEEDMAIIYDRLELALEEHGTKYLEESGHGGAKISCVQLVTEHSDRPNADNSNWEDFVALDEHRELSWGARGTGTAECTGCPATNHNNESRQQLMNNATNSLFQQMMKSVDTELPDVLSEGIMEHASKTCKQGAVKWTASFSI